MSWLYSRALAEEYSAANCSDGEPFAPLKSTPIARAYLLRDKMTDTWSHFPSGMTCAPLTEGHGEALLTWYLAGFRARTLAAQESAPGSAASAAAFGENLRESSAKFVQLSLLSRIHHTYEPGGLMSCSATLPAWGMMRDGVWSARTPPELPISASGCGFELPTPTCAGNEMSPSMKKWPAHKRFATLATTLYGSNKGGAQGRVGMARNSFEREIGGLRLALREWIMGWPIGWTALEPLETDRWRRWCLWLGIC